MRARTSQRRCAGAFLSALSIASLLGRYSSPIPRADDCICRLPFPPPERRDYTSNDPARRHLSAIRHTRRAFPLCCMLRATLRPSCGKYRAACRKRPRALRSCLFMKASSVQNLATPHICALSVQTSWVRCSQCVSRLAPREISIIRIPIPKYNRPWYAHYIVRACVFCRITASVCQAAAATPRRLS